MRHPAAVLFAFFTLIPAAAAQSPRFQILNEPLPENTYGVYAVADFDADGDEDLLTPNFVALNDGSSRFSAGLQFAGGFIPSGSSAYGQAVWAARDLNGDGLPDLAVAGSGIPPQVFLNNGFLDFTPVTLPSLGGGGGGGPGFPGAYGVAVGDVDADGDLDLVVSRVALTLPPLLLLNDGFANFAAAPAAIPSTPSYGDRVILRDFDLDGDDDLLSWPVPVIYYNNGPGVFGPQITLASPSPSVTIEVGDYNGDGFPDLAFTGAVAANGIRFNAGNGFFLPFVATALPAAFLTAVDLNGDGRDELIRTVAGTCSLHQVALNGSIGPASQSIPLAGGRCLARDLDLDGDVDLINDAGVPVLNDATGTLVPLYGHVVPSPAAYVAPLLSGDLDGDGDLDCAWCANATTYVQLSNDGAGNFAPVAVPCPGGCPPCGSTLFPIDFDGDGDRDFFAGSPANTVFRNVGGSWTPFATIPSTQGAVTVAEGDVDGDGLRDLVIGYQGIITGAPVPTSVVRNLGANGFAAPVLLPVSSHTSRVALFDADGDGDLDLVHASFLFPTSVGSSSLFLNDGAGGFSPAPPGAFAVGSHFSVVAADLDGDGDSDLVMEGQILVNGGSGSFTAGAIVPNVLSVMDAFDADLDGDADLLVSPAGLRINNGAGAFPTLETLPYITAQACARGDVDGDGDPDLIGRDPRVYSNTTRQLARGSLARPGRTASLDLYGPPGSQWNLWVSGGTANIPVPTWGTVFIDPALATFFASGTFPATGTTSLSGAVANNPALVGFTVWFQAAILPQHALTNRETIQILGL